MLVIDNCSSCDNHPCNNKWHKVLRETLDHLYKHNWWESCPSESSWFFNKQGWCFEINFDRQTIGYYSQNHRYHPLYY